jgi:hypothetical protein
MMRFRSALLLPILGGLLACGHPPPTIKITPDKSSVAFGSKNFVTLTVTGTINGAQFLEMMQPPPQLSTTAGSFTDPSVGSVQTELADGLVSGGKLTTKLYSPTDKPGPAVVTATVTDDYGTQVSTSVTITFTPPQASRLNFQCKSRNIAAFLDVELDMKVGCEVAALDDNSNPVSNAHIQFLEEAGIMRPSQATDGTLPNYVYYPHQGPRAAPLDVAPLAGEPHWTDMINVIHNPRDGLATLVAYVDGPNPDTGDAYSGDPFVDMNDNGKYDMGEPFKSATGSSTYSPTQSTLIWKQIKILWTGALSAHDSVAKVQVLGGSSGSGQYDLSRTGSGAHKAIQFQIVDDNFNALAANDPSSDIITWNLTPSGQIDFDAGQAPQSPLKDTFGMTIDENNGYTILNAASATAYLIDTQYVLKVANVRSMMDTNPDQAYSVSGTLSRHTYIDDSGQPAGSAGETTQTVGGTLH